MKEIKDLLQNNVLWSNLVSYNIEAASAAISELSVAIARIDETYKDKKSNSFNNIISHKSAYLKRLGDTPNNEERLKYQEAHIKSIRSHLEELVDNTH